jgi:hypothetical protein
VLGFLLAEDVSHFALGSDDKWNKASGDERMGDAQQSLHEWVVATQLR